VLDFLQDQILSGTLGKDHPIWDHVNKLRPILQMRTVEPTDAPTSALFDDMIHDPSDEVLQVAGKLIAIHGEEAHWDGSNLRQRLQEEMGDDQDDDREEDNRGPG
jgi:hypothetical protein